MPELTPGMAFKIDRNFVFGIKLENGSIRHWVKGDMRVYIGGKFWLIVPADDSPPLIASGVSRYKTLMEDGWFPMRERWSISVPKRIQQRIAANYSLLPS